MASTRDARANEPREVEDAVSLRRALDERDARLSMLRSKLDMVERENENLKRVGTTVAVSTGTTTMAAPTTSYGNVGAQQSEREWVDGGAVDDERGERRREG